MRRAFLLLLLTALVGIAGLAGGGVATAATFTVETTGDGPDQNPGDGVCATSGVPPECTLRAAITEANALGGTDVIGFAGAFNGEVADRIVLGSALPTISGRTAIEGGSCGTAGAPAPCVEVGFATSTAAPVLDFSPAHGSSVRGLAITNGSDGIRANLGGSSATPGISVFGTWIGLGLDGSDRGNTGGGIAIGPELTDVLIGSPTPADRNVIAYNNAYGIDLWGANNSVVEGNYIGVAADGDTAAPNGGAIEVTSSSSFSSTGVRIGRVVDQAAQATPQCDGGCNVVGAADGSFAVELGSAIDMQGEGGEGEGAPFETTIVGNHIGLDASGEAPLSFSNHMVRALTLPPGGTPPKIGSVDPGGANHFAATGVVRYVTAASAEIINNTFGTNALGTAHAGSPVGVAIFALGTIAEPSVVSGNRFSHEDTGGSGPNPVIYDQGPGTEITDNVIGVGAGGQQLLGGQYGIYLQATTGATVVTGNRVANSTRAGIYVAGSGSANQIGGELAGEANVITGTLGASGQPGGAIGLEPSASHTQILANRGSNNAGPFIDLDNNGPGSTNANGGIQPPVISTALAGSVTGTSQPNATIRVFGKDSAAPGELAGYLGSTTADGSGSWAFAHPAPLGDGQRIAATQTVIGGLSGTSELAVATTDGAPAAPQITSGPGGPTANSTPTFVFTGEPGAAFDCAIDSAAPTACDSGSFTSTALAEGAHEFSVVQEDTAGQVSPAATRAFSVDTTAPETRITKAPKRKLKTKRKKVKVSFEFAAVDAAGFECSLDGSVFAACDSPFKAKLRKGAHRFAVRAADAVGNLDASPAEARVKVKRKRR